MSDRSIHWAITINNPRQDDEENIAMARRRGWIVEGQLEKGESGTPHYQLMVNCRSQQRFSALKKAFPRGHIKPARNVQALKKYVHKEETRVAELPSSERYVTSNQKLWELVIFELQSRDADKIHRLDWSGDGPYWADRFDALKAFDYACGVLIRRGYYCVETMAVNPQVRSAWKTFWADILVRSMTDRQTDRQEEIFSQSVSIPTYNGQGDATSDPQESQDSREEDDDESDEDSDSAADEGYTEGSGDETGEEDD